MSQSYDIAGMVRFDFAEGPVGFIMSNAPYEYGGLVYQPIPDGIISMSSQQSSIGMSASGFSIILAESPDDGLTEDVILQIEDYTYLDRRVIIYDLDIDPETGAVLQNPEPQISGYMGPIQHDIDDERGAVAICQCETRAIDYGRTNGRYATHQDQQRRSPGDRFFEHSATAGVISYDWGK